MHLQISCQSGKILKSFLSLIPEQPSEDWLVKANAFSRERKFTFRHLIAFCLSHIGNTGSSGISIAIGRFIKNATRSSLCSALSSVDKSSVSRARAKLSWKAFECLLTKAVKMAYTLWDDKPWHTWRGLSVFAIDGSKFRLPSSDILHEEFDPLKIKLWKSKGHYPHCLVTTAYDIFRRFPVGRAITRVNNSERKEAISLLPLIPKGGVVMFDRGYPSYELLKSMFEQYGDGYFVMRCNARSTFNAVSQFVKSNKSQGTIQISASEKFIKRNPHKSRETLSIRAIRLESPDGTVSTILTNLEKNRFSASEIKDLYYRRWEIENYYRDEKVSFELEKFHSKSPNGIKQELYCAAIISVIARFLMMASDHGREGGRIEPQFKNAVITVIDDISIFISSRPRNALKILQEMIGLIKNVKHYRPPKKRPSPPRISKHPVNRWRKCRGDMRKVSKTFKISLKCKC